jgi:hypothetical protein
MVIFIGGVCIRISESSISEEIRSGRDDMPRKKEHFFSGDLVELRNATQILQTLDSNGALDGLPFMPEMTGYGGIRFRVSRRVEKICVEIAKGKIDFREFARRDVVFLEELRCSGKAHDGCQRACMLFWKAGWLQKVEESQPAGPPETEAGEELRAKLKTRTGPDQYYCQSTELEKATQALKPSRRLLKCFYDVRSGDVGLIKMLFLILVPLLRKLRGKTFDPVAGPLRRTRVEKLNLEAGDIVEVKSLEEITQTLDQNSKNRGLFYDRGLGKYSGHQYRVQNRLDFLISESSGKMIKTESTVILENVTCSCNNVVGGCPRQDVVYWREIWLKRINDKTDLTVNSK